MFQGEQKDESFEREEQPAGAAMPEGKCEPGILSCHSSIVWRTAVAGHSPSLAPHCWDRPSLHTHQIRITHTVYVQIKKKRKCFEVRLCDVETGK